MGEPLELSYNWRTPAVIVTLGAVLCLAAVLRGRVDGWLPVAVLVVVVWALFLGVLYLRTRAYLQVDGTRLTVRRFRRMHTVAGPDLVKVSQFLTQQAPSYTLTVRRSDGRTERVIAPVAMLRDGHATLFAWILAEAPHAELDPGSRRTVERLQTKGLL
jgi:hypothetical protein